MNRNSLWWGPPKKFTTDKEERKISWLELFYDLVYVIVISRTTQHFAQHADFNGFVYYVFIFGMIFWGWMNGSMYYDIHGTPGIRTNLTTLWQMLAVAALAVSMNFENDPDYLYLTVTLAFLQAYITYLWWSVGIYDKTHRKFNRTFNIFYLGALALLIGAVYVAAPLKTIFYWLALLLNFAPSFFINRIMKRTGEELSLSPSMTERLGLFTIIVFGEVILGVINGMHDCNGHGRKVWLAFSLCILIVFSLWLIFFSLVADRECKPGFLKGQYFQFLFIPALLSLGIIGASFSVMLPGTYMIGYQIPENIRLFFGFSIAVFLLCLNCMTSALVYEEKYGNPKNMFTAIILVPAVLISGITLLSGQISLLQYFSFIFLVLLVMIVAITYSWYRAERNPG